MDATERRPDWYNHDELWEDTMNIMFGNEVWERAPEEVEQVLMLGGLTPPIRVLDLPCGPGRHALEFARLGCAVTGVDRTPAYLKQARERIDAAKLDVKLIEADMLAFKQPAAFDLVSNLYTSFGYFEAMDDDMQVLANFYDCLRPGGVLVMDLIGKEILARKYTPRDWNRLDDGTLVLQERSLHHDWSWIENRWIIIKDGKQHDYRLAHRLYGASDLRHALKQTGFLDIQIYGHLSGIPYDQDARRLVAVAHRPD